jgi:hypothetical protein
MATSAESASKSPAASAPWPEEDPVGAARARTQAGLPILRALGRRAAAGETAQ